MIFTFNFGSNTCCPSNTDAPDAKVPQEKIGQLYDEIRLQSLLSDPQDRDRFVFYIDNWIWLGPTLRLAL